MDDAESPEDLGGEESTEVVDQEAAPYVEDSSALELVAEPGPHAN